MNHSNLTIDQQALQQPTPEKIEGLWSKAQHRLFLAGIDIHGNDWKSIAKMVRTRNESQVRSHAQKYNNKLQNDRERIGAGAVEIRPENGVAITRSRSRGNTQTKNPEDPTPNTHSNPLKTKKINKDQEKANKRVLFPEVKKQEKKKKAKKAKKVSNSKIIIPQPLWYSNYRIAPISDQPQRSFYYDPAMGSQLQISAFSAFRPYGSQDNTRENVPREMTKLGNQINQDFQ